jgi:hypothetical protein
LMRRNKGKRVLSGAADDSKYRKMFSHREHGFPTRKGRKAGNSKVLFEEALPPYPAAWLRFP